MLLDCVPGRFPYLTTSTMLQKKICMLGSYGVGKTSLVERFVHSKFSDKYLSTIGVKVERKQVEIRDTDLRLMLWDLHGDDEFQRVRASYLRGMSGYLLVVDGTRSESLQVALDLHHLAIETVGEVPFVALINKIDLANDWEIDEQQLEALSRSGWLINKTSAKTGQLVNQTFLQLAEAILARKL